MVIEFLFAFLSWMLWMSGWMSFYLLFLAGCWDLPILCILFGFLRKINSICPVT